MAPAPRFSAQEQETLIINAAIKAIEESSLLDFSMSAVAKLAGLSMGSVYKFVQCKEDVLIALATRMYQERHLVFKKVLSLPLTTPERLIAMSLLDCSKVDMYTFGNQLESIVNNEALMKRCSARWLTQMINCGERCQNLFQQFLQNAADSGELTSGNRDIEEIKIGIWSLSVGYFQSVRLHLDRHNEEQDNTNIAAQITENAFVLAPNDAHVCNMRRLINSYDWKQNISDNDIKKVCLQLSDNALR
ncbi:TetR/AcrR family transcriptional regulator [Psychromonas sp. Urea-02u-13]|uniref:TetR/AcrR family transcriptional regulator n=1 Tax=Psychromonas sp. Urea-02u-13 TaxID=2058326 RepID=UPI000C31EDE7|nr:TetR/AcrR family transcriptional regulator [Psychromonas sp. Urea-02u-13]PKG38008.1 TetR/AcrR family transcriptional regulator [Psychromonas sp. Urea-02u-13]